MPTLEQRVLIELLAGEISGKGDLSEAELKTVDWQEVLKEANMQAVTLMAAEGAVKYREYIRDYSEWQDLAAVMHAANMQTAYNEQQLNLIMKGRSPIIPHNLCVLYAVCTFAACITAAKSCHSE